MRIIASHLRKQGIEFKSLNDLLDFRHSIEELSLRSPVQQIRRASKALFNKINEGIARGKIRLDKHHWGSRKVPIKNLIVLINQKPAEAFQYVKVLTLIELVRYVQYFEPCLSPEETQSIANYILASNQIYNQ